MIKAIYILLLLCISLSGYSQTLDSLLKSIERNNPQIQSQAKWLETERARSRTGIYPSNPEVSFNYMWGSPDAIGNQQEFEVTQSFRFPTYYFTKAGMQELQLEQKVLVVEKSKREILSLAYNEYCTLVWLGKREEVLNKRVNESETLLSIMQQGYDRKEFSKPAFDKARIYHLNVQNELQKLKSEIQIHKELLQQINGGISLENLLILYPQNITLPDLNSILSVVQQQNSDILIAEYNTGITEKQVKLENMNRLPKLEAGYKSETILNQKLQGFHTGISIPLWENKNLVKQSKLENIWSQSYYDQVVSEVTANLKLVYAEALASYQNYSMMKDIMESSQLSESSMQLLKSGEISFSEYITEVQFIFESQFKYLENELNYYISLNKLKLIVGE